MAKKENLLKMLAMQMGPQKLEQMAAAATQSLMSKMQGVPPEAIDQLIKVLEYVMDNPEQYAEVVQRARASGALRSNVLPDRFDPVKIGLLLLAFYGVRSRMRGQPMAMKRGGLARAAEQLRQKGRYGDTMLAHINPAEAAMLKRAGGSGTINPETGLPEFFFDFLTTAFTNLGNFFDQALGSVAGSLGLDVGAGVLGDVAMGALTGAASSALTGGNPLAGAVTGGFGASPLATDLGGWVGNSFGGIGKSLVDAVGAQNLGAGLIGGLGGALTGQDPLMSGLITGGQTAALRNLGGIGSPNVAPGITLPDGSLPGGPQAPLSGQEQIASSLLGGGPGITLPASGTGITLPAGADIPMSGAATKAGGLSVGSDMNDMIKMGALGLGVAKLIGGMTPQQAQQQINRSTELTPEQKAMMNRALDEYVIEMNPITMPSPGTPEYAQFMDKVQKGQEVQWFNPTMVKKARGGRYNMGGSTGGGGALSMASRYVTGEGSGRDDLIDAKLSDGEYVFDAETVALLGDGSNDEGAKRLDEMRNRVRQHKGKVLAKGKFSPDAKHPLAYFKGGRM